MKRGEFTLQSFDPPFTFQASLGDGAPMPTDDSYGGLAITPVPKRMGITEYGSQNPMGITIDFYVDRINDGDTDYVSRQRVQLELLAGRSSRTDFEPPVCVVDGSGRIPHDLAENPHSKWQIETLSWDRDQTVNGVTGPLRISGTIGLREWNVDETLGGYRGPADRNRKKHKVNRTSAAKSKGRGSGGSYVIHDGDSLSGIASRELGDSKRWKEIAELNNIRNPRKLVVGRRLRMPK